MRRKQGSLLRRGAPIPPAPRCPYSPAAPTAVVESGRDREDTPHLAGHPAAVLHLSLASFRFPSSPTASPADDELFPNRRNGSRPWDPANDRPLDASPCQTLGGGSMDELLVDHAGSTDELLVGVHPARPVPADDGYPAPSTACVSCSPPAVSPGCERRQRVGGKCITVSSETWA
ncbi:uncharacterized protein [Triticum aestivum]|uniref:uncharacterized protein n=1 Tax=Triticum aestivum TaxID=4565 RepID=UPI001D016750|nr:uncharacterized protein LOC123110931 [Triticum aestivum]